MKKTIEVNNIIFTQIENRYHFLDRMNFSMRKYEGRLLADSFYPQYVAKSILRRSNSNLYAVKSSYAISERIARDMGIRQLHISELITMLGYTKTDISKLLQSVKNKSLSIILAGIGGTGSNFLYFMYKMSEWVGKKGIFYSIRAYDEDKYDVPNLLRIPFIPKINPGQEDGVYKTLTIPEEFKLIADNFNTYNTFLNKIEIEAIARRNSKTSTIIYGAPGMASRKMMTESDLTFIAATHKDNQFSLIENPEIDEELIIETYGKINLSMFFMNHLSMTIRFLEELRDRTEPFGSYPGPEANDDGSAIRIKRQNHTIASEDFTEKHALKLEDGFKSGSKRIYVPKVTETNIDNNLVLPEEN